MSSSLYLCGVCDREVGIREASAVCTTCRNWIHLRSCANMFFKEARKVKDTFSCSACIGKKDDNILFIVHFASFYQNIISIEVNFFFSSNAQKYCLLPLS